MLLALSALADEQCMVRSFFLRIVVLYRFRRPADMSTCVSITLS